MTGSQRRRLGAALSIGGVWGWSPSGYDVGVSPAGSSVYTAKQVPKDEVERCPVRADGVGGARCS